MAAAPIYIGTPKTWQGQATVANTNRDGTGTIVTLVTAGASGSRIDSLRVTPVGTVTAGVVRFFLDDGTNKRLFKEVMISAVTPSATVEDAPYDLSFAEGLVLPNGWALKFATHNAEIFNAFARGGDF